MNRVLLPLLLFATCTEGTVDKATWGATGQNKDKINQMKTLNQQKPQIILCSYQKKNEVERMQTI